MVGRVVETKVLLVGERPSISSVSKVSMDLRWRPIIVVSIA